MEFQKDRQYYKFCAYGFFRTLKFFDPFLLLFFLDRGLSFGVIGTLYAFREVVIHLLETLSGMIADLIGRKRILVAAFLSYLISFLLFFLAHSGVQFFVAIFFFGVGEACRTGTHKAMILSYLKHKGWESDKTQYYGHTRGWSQRGAAIASLISGALVLYSGNYQYLFVASMVPYIVDLLLILSYPNYLNGSRKISEEPSKLQKLDHTQELQRSQVSTSTVQFLFRQFLRESRAHLDQLIAALKNPSARKALLQSIGFTSYYKATKDYLQLWIVAWAVTYPLYAGIGKEENGALYVAVVYCILYFLTSIASRYAYRVEQRLQSPERALIWLQYLGISLGVMAGVCGILGVQGIPILLLSGVLIIQNLRKPITLTYVSSYFPHNLMASALSLESQTETLCTAFFALSLGWLTQLFGVEFGLLFFSISLLILGIFSCRNILLNK